MLRPTRRSTDLSLLPYVSASRKRKRYFVEFSEKSMFWFGIGEQINGIHNASMLSVSPL